MCMHRKCKVLFSHSPTQVSTLCREPPSERLVVKRFNPHTNREQYRLTDQGREYSRIAPSMSSLGRDEDDESDLEDIQSRRGNRRPSLGRRRQDGTATRRRPVSGEAASPRQILQPLINTASPYQAVPIRLTVGH